MQPYAPIAPVPSKSGSGFKILLIVLVCFLGAGLLAVGALFYAAHRVKQAVVEKAASYGVELPSSSSSSSSIRPARRVPACQLLSKEEATRILGEPVERTEDQSGTCLYYGPPGLSEKLGREGVSDTFQRAQAPGATVNGGEMAEAMTRMLGSVAAAQKPGGGDAPLLTLVVEWEDGKAQMTAISILNAGVSRADALKGGSADIPNLGDRAIRLANLGLNVLQGNALIRILPGPVPGAYDKELDVARTVLPRM